MTLYVITFVFILIAYLPLLRVAHWSVRIWGFVRVQTTVLQFILLSLLLIFDYPIATWEWITAGVLFLTMIFQLAVFIPYTKHFPRKRRKPKSYADLKKITLITSNVLQPNDNYEKFMQLVQDQKPDMFLTMESNSDWEKALKPLEKDYPHVVRVPLENLYGMHLYSKFELEDTEVRYQVEKDIPSIFTKVKYRQGPRLNLICIHPAPPSPTENETSKERDAELLLTGKEVRDLESPIIVCGDLNDVVWSNISRLFKKMTGLQDPRIGRGLFPSYNANYWFMRFPIDQLFYSTDMYMEHMCRLPYFGSDHFAMYYEIWIDNKAEDQTDPELDEETEEEIEERIEEGIVSAMENEQTTA